jgi:signal transduction histidine kinase
MDHTAFFLGMAFLQVIFITYQYVLFKRQEFIYYLLYTFCISLFIFLKTYPDYNPISVFVTKDQVFAGGRGLLLIGYAMYYRFGRHFTETPSLYKSLNRNLIIVEFLMILFGSIDIMLLVAGVDFNVLEPFSRLFFLFLMTFSLYVIGYLITRRKKLTSILVIGSGLLLLFATLAFIDQIYISKGAKPESHYMVYIELGVFFEFLFLNFGLIYKTRLLQKEKLKLEVERQAELYSQRMRISSDLHDEVGATLSGIALYSNLAKTQLTQNLSIKTEQSLTIIEQNSSEMVNKLNDIVWAVNPNYDSVESLMNRLQEYAMQMSTVKNISCHLEIEENIYQIKLPMEYKKNIYLLCKEAINNAIKYSGATDLLVKAEIYHHKLLVVISDNGCGFDEEIVSKGNGLLNMQQRAAEMNAVLKKETFIGKGSSIKLLVNLE